MVSTVSFSLQILMVLSSVAVTVRKFRCMHTGIPHTRTYSVNTILTLVVFTSSQLSNSKFEMSVSRAAYVNIGNRLMRADMLFICTYLEMKKKSKRKKISVNFARSDWKIDVKEIFSSKSSTNILCIYSFGFLEFVCFLCIFNKQTLFESKFFSDNFFWYRKNVESYHILNRSISKVLNYSHQSLCKYWMSKVKFRSIIMKFICWTLKWSNYLDYTVSPGSQLYCIVLSNDNEIRVLSHN